jgi:HEAT repeat protein
MITSATVTYATNCSLQLNMTDTELKDMLIEYMGKGFLENIIDMFKHDPSLFRFLPDLISSENTRVRIGAVALVEELRDSFKDKIEETLPALVRLLENGDDTLRGDIAYLISILNTPSAHDILKTLCNTENPDIREIVEETLRKTGKC